MQNLILCRRPLHIGKALLERGNLVRFGRLRHHQLAPAALNGPHHAVNVVMTHSCDSEANLVLGFSELRVGLCHLMRDRTGKSRGKRLQRQSTSQPRRSSRIQKHPPIESPLRQSDSPVS
jgi:hypothetical protein